MTSELFIPSDVSPFAFVSVKFFSVVPVFFLLQKLSLASKFCCFRVRFGNHGCFLKLHHLSKDETRNLTIDDAWFPISKMVSRFLIELCALTIHTRCSPNLGN